MEMSDTPRTNAASVWARVVDQTDHGPPHEKMVYESVAKELELELNEWRDVADRLVQTHKSIGIDDLAEIEREALAAYEKLKEQIK